MATFLFLSAIMHRKVIQVNVFVTLLFVFLQRQFPLCCEPNHGIHSWGEGGRGGGRRGGGPSNCNIHRQQLDSDMGMYKARTSVCLELDGAIAKTLWRLAFLCTVLRGTIKFTYQNRMITTIFAIRPSASWAIDSEPNRPR